MLRPGAWSLDFYRALTPPVTEPTALSMTAHLPPDGRLEAWLASPRPAGGLGLVLSRIGEPASSVITRGAGGDRPLQCSGALPPPSASTDVSIAPTSGGVSVTVAGTTVTCRGMLRGGAPSLRPGLRRVLVSDIILGSEAVPGPGPRGRPLWWLVGAVLGGLVAGAEQRLRARPVLVTMTSVPLLLAAWLAPRDLRSWVEAFRAPWLDPTWVPVLFPVLLAGLAKLTHFLGRQLREPTAAFPWWATALAATPLALVATLSTRGLPRAVIAPVLLAAAVAAIWPARWLMRRLGSQHPDGSVLWIVASGSAAALLLSATGITHQIAAPLGFGAGAAWGLLVWANANPQHARAYNLLSLTAALLTLSAVEGTLRYTPIGVAWSGMGARTQQNDLYGWLDVANEEFQLLEAGQHTDYPDKGFPVAFSAPGGTVRVVAMGGSTTGGAYQNDDLNDFYPARLAERLSDRFEVLNQGVGGWTTWHIRAYLTDHIDALRPDILTLYVGHNDALTRTPLPYKDLYAAWKRGGGLGQTSSALGQLRLYQGLRFFLVSMMSDRDRVAVPLSDAEDNLQAIIALVTGRGGKVLLASEGLSPDPGPLADYNAMMAQTASAHDNVWYVDTAGILYAEQGPSWFLDDCHLTEAGHQLVAGQLYDVLMEMVDEP